MKLYDRIRQIEVERTPEEIVRQALVQKMIGQLGYPKNLLAIEKELSFLPGLRAKSSRRFDLVCFMPKKEGLSPLLLVECKAKKLGPKAKEQVLGYQFSLMAPFICLASQSEIYTFWTSGSQVELVPFLPHFKELVSAIP